MSLLKAIIFLIILLNQIVASDENTNLNLGGGIAYISLPEYIGSSGQKNYLVPYPYIYYTSKNLTIEKNTIFNHLYRSANFEIDISLSGTLPVKDSIHSLRTGMKQLDPTLEIGPNFIYKLIHFEDKKGYLSFEMPIRIILSTDFSDLNHQGYVTNPNLYIKYYLQHTSQIEFSSGPSYNTRKYNNYFYEVTSNDMTEKREEYHSKGGYGGWKTTLGLSSTAFENIWLGAFIRYYNLNHAVFTDSPLVSKENALFYGLAFSYIFKN